MSASPRPPPPDWRAWRQQRGLTQAALADAASTTPTMITHIEAGRRTPSARLLQRLCVALGLTDAERSAALALSGEVRPLER